MTQEEFQQHLNEIKEDPKLMILSQAIIDLSGVVAQSSKAIVHLNERIDAVLKSVQTMNETMNLITSQMWILSQKPGFPLAFRGGQIK